MRILFLSNMRKVSGGEIFLERFLHELNEKFTFRIALPEGNFADRLRAGGFPVFINREVGRLNREEGFTNPLYLKQLIKWVSETSRVVKEDQTDLIIANSFGMALHASLLSFITGKRFIWFHLHPIMEAGTKSALVARMLSLRSSAIPCCSMAVKDSLVACGVKEKKLFVTYTGVNTDIFKDDSTLEALSEPDDLNGSLFKLYTRLGRKIHLALICLVVPWKGHRYLIEAINLLPGPLKAILSVDMLGGVMNDSAFILGYKLELEGLISHYKLQDTVRFLNFQADLKEYYKDIDLLLNCSQEPEPMGNTIVEAMAYSKIAIVTNQGGPLELVEDKVTGFITDSKDPQSLATVIEKVCTRLTVAELISMQVKARMRAVTHYDVRDTSRKLEEIFLQIQA